MPLRNGVYNIGNIDFAWDYKPCTTFDLWIASDSSFSQNLQIYNSINSNVKIGIYSTGIYYTKVRCSGEAFSSISKFTVIDLASSGQLKLWLRADSGLILNNSKVVHWINLADTSLIFSQGADNFRPTFLQSGLLGYPSVRFGMNSASTWLNLNGTLTLDSFSLFQVVQQASTTNTLQYFLAGHLQGFIWGGTYNNCNFGIYDGTTLMMHSAAQSTWPRVLSQSKSHFSINNAFVGVNYLFGSALGQILLTTLGARSDATNPAFQLYANGACSELILFENSLPPSIMSSVSEMLMTRFSKPLFLPYDTLACAPNVVFTLPNDGSVASALWSNGSTQLQSVYSTPGTHWVRVVNRFGVTLTDTFRVSGVFPAPLVTESGIKPLCLGDTLSQVYMNPDPIQPWQWNTGSTTDTLKITRPGQYWLLQTDSSGCVLSSDTLEVINRVDSEIALSLAGCSGDTSLFSAQAGDLLGSPIVFYDWDFGPNGSLDTFHLAQAATVFNQPGPQTIRLIAYNSLGCPDTTALTIQVPGSPTAQFSQPHACAGTPMPLSNQSVIPPGTNVSSYRWEYWNGQSSNLVGPLLHFSDTGMYPIALKVFLANGCSDSIQSNLHVFRQVNAHFVLPFDSLCQFAPLPLSDASTYLNSSPGQAVWRLGSTQADTGFALQLNPLESGLLPLRLSVKSAEGCVDSLQKQVWVNATPQADIGLSQQLGFPPLAISVWDASDKSYPARTFGLNGQQFWSDSLLSLNLTDTGLYRFSLLVTDNLGCRDSSTKNLRLIRPELSTEIKNLRCEKKGSLYAPDFELQNSSVLLPIQKESFDFWVENSATMRWEDSVLVPPGLTVGFQSKGSLNAPKSPRFCCVKPVSLISEYAPGLFLNVSGETTCAALVDPFFLADVQPNPSRGEVLVRFHLSAPGKVSWRVIGGDGKSALLGEGDYAAGMQQFSIPAKTLAQGSYSLFMTQGDNVGVSKFIVLE